MNIWPVEGEWLIDKSVYCLTLGRYARYMME